MAWSQLLSCLVFSPLSCVPRIDWKLLQTHPRSWDLMRREDSSVIAVNPDAGDAFQVIRPRAHPCWWRVVFVLSCREDLFSPGLLTLVLGDTWRSPLLSEQRCRWQLVTERSLGSWDGERESRDGVLNSVAFRVVVIMLMSNNRDKWAPLSNALSCFLPTVHAGVRVVTWKC